MSKSTKNTGSNIVVSRESNMKNKVEKIVLQLDPKKKNKFSVNELMVVEAINENINVLFEGKGGAVKRINEFINQEEELKEVLIQVIQFIVNIFVNNLGN